MVSQPVYVVLDSIRSAYNVGAIFRTCEAAGVTKLWLGGYTPAPIDRFGRVVQEIEKTSLGASGMVPWEVAVECALGAVSLYDFTSCGPVAYVFGNEVTGLSTDVQRLCGTVVAIPMRGQKESLNVATAVGVVLFQP